MNAGAPIRRTVSPPVGPVERLTVEVIRTYPHSTDAYTQGLIFHAGELFESTGLAGKSQLRRIALETGDILAAVALGPDIFAEGLARHGERLVQLTFDSGRAIIWNVSDFGRTGEFQYPGEGWGLCHDGTRFVMSDGTNRLQLRDSDTFELLDTIDVNLKAKTQFGFLHLNELECVGEDVFANVFQYRELVRISPANGEITAIIDTRRLLLHPDVPVPAIQNSLHLNGIAYLPESGHFLLTGKHWPRIFEVRLVKDELFQ